jgi:hypothetical protein
MKLISPLVSRMAQRIFLSESIGWMRAWAAISSTEMRSRRRLSSIGLPSSTSTTGLPSRIGRVRGNRQEIHEVATIMSANVPTASTAPVTE